MPRAVTAVVLLLAALLVAVPGAYASSGPPEGEAETSGLAPGELTVLLASGAALAGVAGVTVLVRRRTALSG